MGQEVWLDAKNIKTKAPSKKSEQKCLGPFTIMKQISPVTYQLQLTAHMNIHPVFHVDLLAPYKVTAEYGILFKHQAPETIDGQEEYEVNEILGERRHGCHARLGVAISVQCSSWPTVFFVLGIKSIRSY